jgi:hypothetical protein
MPQLSDFVQKLESFVREVMPTAQWRQVQFIESSSVDYSEPVPCVSAAELMTVEAFQRPFESALHSGYAWVNLTALGVLDGSLVVALERPRATTGALQTSVNMSGPTRGNVDWRVGKR